MLPRLVEVDVRPPESIAEHKLAPVNLTHADTSALEVVSEDESKGLESISHTTWEYLCNGILAAHIC